MTKMSERIINQYISDLIDSTRNSARTYREAGMDPHEAWRMSLDFWYTVAERDSTDLAHRFMLRAVQAQGRAA